MSTLSWRDGIQSLKKIQLMTTTQPLIFRQIPLPETTSTPVLRDVPLRIGLRTADMVEVFLVGVPLQIDVGPAKGSSVAVAAVKMATDDLMISMLEGRRVSLLH